MAIAKLATQCPIPTYFGANIRVYDGENTSGNAPVSRRFQVNNNLGISSSKLNANFTMADLHARYGGGAYGVCRGLTLSSGAGLILNIAEGHAMADGLIEYLGGTATLTDNQINYIWIRRNWTAQTTDIFAVPGSLTPPAADSVVYLGQLPVVAGVQGTIDTSGVMYIVNGVAERSTADPGKPGDTPSASTRFWTKTNGGLWWWDGTRYYRQMDGMSVNQFSIPAGENIIIPPNTQAWLYAPFTCDGGLTVDGALRIDN